MPSIRKSNGKYYISDLNLKLPDDMLLDTGGSLECEVRILDNRLISDKQRKFIFALCDIISYEQGESADYVRALLQQFNANMRGIEVESLSKCSVTYANGLIDTIITHAIDEGIPLPKKILEDNDYKFTYQQTYIMALKRICVVCGKRADLHHTTALGMGANRKTMSHLGLEILPLCREHHTECHTIGNDKFMELNHLKPVTVDEKLEIFIKSGKLRLHQEEKQ